MLIRSWLTYQGPSIRGTLANRVSNSKSGRRTQDLLAPYAMKYVAVATHYDDALVRIAARIPRRLAPDAMLTRVLRFVADRSPLMGEVAVPRERWGAVVLRVDWGDVSRSDGEAVHDALLAERIGIPATPESRLQRVRDVLSLVRYEPIVSPSGDVTGYVSRDVSGGASGYGSGGVPPSSSSSSSSAPSSEPSLPPSPRARGASSTSSHDGPSGHDRNGHGAAPRPLRPRERERFGKVLDYAVLRGTTAEQAMARVDREAHRRGPLDDARIAELLVGRYAWVTRQKLARWLAEGRVGWRERRAAAEAPRPVRATEVALCPRHGRPESCTVCEATTPVESATAGQVVAAALAKLARQVPTDRPPTEPRAEVAATSAIPAEEFERRRAAALAVLGQDEVLEAFGA